MVAPNTAIQMDCSTSQDTIEDTYFLDREMALQTALQKNQVLLVNGKQCTQVCYYDGDFIDNAPLNLIHVPVNTFTSFFSKNLLTIPTKIVCQQDVDENARAEIESAFTQMVNDITKVRQEQLKQWQEYPPHQDAYFLDNRVAYQTAVQQNRVFLNHPTKTGLQVCYYDGELVTNGPENLIHVPAEHLYDYLSNCRTRIPSRIVFPAATSETDFQAGALAFQDLITQVKLNRANMVDEFKQAAINAEPAFDSNGTFRLFFLTDHRTQVLQYACKNLAKALEKLGHDTFISIEQNDMELMDSAWHLNAFLDFKPNVVISINHSNNTWQHQDVFCISWWQDAMPEITKHQPIDWRERDIVLSATASLDEHLHACGAKQVLREHFCINPDIFHTNYTVERANKVVFVGSSYSVSFVNRCRSAANPQQWLRVAQQLIQYLNNGELITEEILQALAKAHQVDYHSIYWYIFPYAVREASIEWICENSPIPVEVYGRHWADNEKVAPYYKGELPHGEAVAEVYNSAKYAIISHPFDVNSQRLAEAAACGCIPVVYDCRHFAEPPHWDDECLFFSSREQLHAQLDQKPKSNPVKIGETFTYDGLAKRVVDLLNQALSRPPANSDPS